MNWFVLEFYLFYFIMQSVIVHFLRKWLLSNTITVLKEENFVLFKLIIDRHEIGLWTHPLWRRLCKQINSFRWLSLKISNSTWLMTLKAPLRTIVKRFLQFIKSVCQKLQNRQENFVIFKFFSSFDPKWLFHSGTLFIKSVLDWEHRGKPDRKIWRKKGK